MLSDDQRTTLCAVADRLIPASAKMPCFSASGAQRAELDRVLELRPEVLPALLAALDLVAGADTGDEALEAWLHRTDPAALAVIAQVASSAYYLSPDIRKLIGYPGQVQRPVADDEEADYEDLLQVVVDRGPIFRPTRS